MGAAGPAVDLLLLLLDLRLLYLLLQLVLLLMMNVVLLVYWSWRHWLRLHPEKALRVRRGRSVQGGQVGRGRGRGAARDTELRNSAIEKRKLGVRKALRYVPSSYRCTVLTRATFLPSLRDHFLRRWSRRFRRRRRRPPTPERRCWPRRTPR